ncbi:MAG: hypothetical protein J6J36_06445 [Clostridia bacterium]|nr:hypothetical protein [Clostridia bacterium]
MKKSGKILVFILCLVIIALVTFIVVDKFAIEKNNNNTNTESNNAMIKDSVDNGTKNEIVKNNEKTKNEIVGDETENNKTKIANEEIKKVLKDESWLKENVKFNNGKEEELTFAKMKNINGNPAYLIIAYDEASYNNNVVLVTYENGKIVVCKQYMEMGAGEVSVDLNKSIVCYTSDAEGEVEYYNIDNNKFVKFANTGYNADDGNIYYYVGGENVSYGRYNTLTEDINAVKIETKLSNENIEKFVK